MQRRCVCELIIKVPSPPSQDQADNPGLSYSARRRSPASHRVLAPDQARGGKCEAGSRERRYLLSMKRP